MLITAAEPCEIERWFHEADHGQRVMCLVVGTGLADHKKIASLIEDLYKTDAMLGQRVAFMLFHPSIKKSFSLTRGGGEMRVQADVFPSPAAIQYKALRETSLFSDVSSHAEMMQKEFALQIARSCAQQSAGLMKHFGVDARQCPAIVTLVRSVQGATVFSLGADWKPSVVSEYFGRLRDCINRLDQLSPIPPLLNLRRETRELEDLLASCASCEREIDYRVRGLVAKYKPSVSAEQLADFYSSKDRSTYRLECLFSNLGFTEGSKAVKDGRIGKCVQLAKKWEDRVENLRARQVGRLMEGEQLRAERVGAVQEEIFRFAKVQGAAFTKTEWAVEAPENFWTFAARANDLVDILEKARNLALFIFGGAGVTR